MLHTNTLDFELKEGMEAANSPKLVEVLLSCWRLLRRRYLVIVICFLLALSAGGAYFVMAPVSYTASAMLLIDTRKGQFSPERAVVGDISIDSPWIETQLAILVGESNL